MCLPTFVLWILWRWRPDAVTCRNFVCYVWFLVFYVHLFVTAITCKNKTQSIQFQNSVELLTKRHTPLLSRKSTQQHSHFTYGCKWISISTLYISNWYGQRYIWSPCNSVVQLSIVKKRAMKPTLKGVNIILLVFSTFSHPKWITFSTGDVHKKKKLLFRANRRYGTPYFTYGRKRPIRAFHFYCPIYMKFGTRDEHNAADQWSVS